MLKLITVLITVTLLAYISESSYKKKADYYLKNISTRPDGTASLKEPARRLDVWCIIAILIMGFFSGLRIDYNDTYLYILQFRDAPTVGEYLAEQGFKFAGNPLFYMLNAFVRQLTDDYHILFILIAVFSFWVYVSFLKKHAKDFTLSTYFLFTTGSFVFLLTAMKQAIAIAVLLMAIDRLLEKKYIWFYLFVLLATFFHFYALVFVVLPLFTGRPWNHMTFLLLLGMLITMVAFEDVITAFMNSADGMGKNIADEEVFSQGINIFRALVYAVIPIITFIFRHKIEELPTEENLFINMSIICFAVLCIGTVSGGNMFGRVAAYFDIGPVIALPIVINRCFDKKTANAVATAAVVCYFAYFLYEYMIARNFGNAYKSISIFQFLESLSA